MTRTPTASAVPDLSHHRTSIRDGVCVTTFDSDPGSTRPSIVLLPRSGSTGGADFWALAPMLATRYRTATLEVTAVDEAAGLPDEQVVLREVEAAVDALRAGSDVHLLGYSSGAVTAAALAVRNPDRISSLTLVAGWSVSDEHQRLQRQLTDLLADRPEALTLWWTLSTFSPDFLNSRAPQDVRALVRRTEEGIQLPTDVDVSDLLTRVTVPTLVIACTRDTVAPPRHSRLLAGAVTHARYAEVPSGHGVLSERPSEVFDLVDRFLRNPTEHPGGAVVPALHA